MGDSNPQTEFEDNTEAEETLMALNDYYTGGNMSSVMLSGELGFHIFAENDAEGPMAEFQKRMHLALDEAMQEVFIDESIVRDYHGEVTGKTVCATVEDQIEDFLGHGGLDRAFLQALGRQYDVEADVMGAGKLFSDDNPAEVF